MPLSAKENLQKGNTIIKEQIRTHNENYGGHSETEPVSVNYEGLAIPSLLKIQSAPLGNLWDQAFDGDKSCPKQVAAC